MRTVWPTSPPTTPCSPPIHTGGTDKDGTIAWGVDEELPDVSNPSPPTVCSSSVRRGDRELLRRQDRHAPVAAGIPRRLLLPARAKIIDQLDNSLQEHSHDRMEVSLSEEGNWSHLN